MMRHDNVTLSKPAMIATQEGNSLIGGMIEGPPVERDIDLAEEDETSGAAGQELGKTI